jgi:hypothetical protein
MSEKRPPPAGQGSGPAYDGHQPVISKRGYQPASNPKPGAGHQPTGTGTPQPPRTGSGVKPAPAPKK